MDRRSFAKIATLFGLAPLAPRGEREMAKIGDIFANFARGDRLNHAEIEQVRREMNMMQAQARQSANLIGGAGQLDGVHFKDAYFEDGPLVSACWYRVGAQAIGDAAWTAISWPTFMHNRGIVKWDSAAPTKFILPPGYKNKKSLIGILTTASFDTDTTGIRRLSWAAYDSGDNLTARVVMSTMEAVGEGEYSSMSGASFFNYTAGDAYFTIEVHQSSGGALNLGLADVTLFQLN